LVISPPPGNNTKPINISPSNNQYVEALESPIQDNLLVSVLLTWQGVKNVTEYKVTIFSSCTNALPNPPNEYLANSTSYLISFSPCTIPPATYPIKVEWTTRAKINGSWTSGDTTTFFVVPKGWWQPSRPNPPNPP